MHVLPRRLLVVAGTLSVLAIVVAYVARFLAVDSCLDSGGVYDYASHLCRTDAKSLPRGPLLPHWVVALSIALSTAAFALAAVPRKPSRS